MVITGIGSRSTPQSILDAMSLIGTYCRENKIWVRSGHAEGADFAFEAGSQEFCIAYLPWDGFNKHLVSKAHQYVIKPNCHTIEITKKYHPAFDKLSYGALALQCRNANQVLGKNLDSPTKAVVCWTPGGREEGGTSQAIRIAKAHNIPIFNMALTQYSDHLKVIDELKRIKKT